MHLKDNDEVLESLAERIAGRISLYMMFFIQKQMKLIISSNDMISDKNKVD